NPTTLADADGHESDGPCGCGGMTAEDVHFMVRDVQQLASDAWSGVKIDAQKIGSAIQSTVENAAPGGSNPASMFYNGATEAQPSGQNAPSSSSSQSTPAQPPEGGKDKYENSPQNQQRMSQGKAPLDKDGKPVELHH